MFKDAIGITDKVTFELTRKPMKTRKLIAVGGSPGTGKTTLFRKFMTSGEGFPAKELKVIDCTLRMFIEPTLVLNKDMLVAHLEGVKAKKAIRKALRNQVEGRGYSFVEVLAECPTHLRQLASAEDDEHDQQQNDEFGATET